MRQSKPHVVSVDSRPTKAYKVADEVRLDGLGHYPISWSVRKCTVYGKSCRDSCEKYKRSLHVKTCFRFSMKSNITMTLLPQHVLYSLSKNVL